MGDNISIIVLLMGLLIGIILSLVAFKVFYISFFCKGYMIIFMSCILCYISYSIFGFNINFLFGIILNSILIIVSFVDYEYRIIPDIFPIITLVLGIGFAFFMNHSFLSTVLSMLVGGGILLILSLIPKAMGGGDIKLMFALGSFLTIQKVTVTLFVAFILSAVVSILLLAFKIKGPKDHIPFGPFLSIGCFISFHFYT